MFRYEENLFAVDITFTYGITYTFLIVVCLCCIDHAITDL